MKIVFIVVLVVLVVILGVQLQSKQMQSNPALADALVVPNIESKLAQLEKLPIADLKALAESGDSRSQVALADVYYLGVGVDKDVSVARDLYRLAAAQGSDIAVERLSRRYGTSFVVEDATSLSYAIADKPDLRRSKRGSLLVTNPLPIDRVATLYSDGIDLVGQDNESALTYLQKAAEHGHAEAQFYVGVAYLRGFGTQVDVERGSRWLIHAAENGTANAKYKLGMMYKNGLLLKRDAAQAKHWIAQAKYAGFPVDQNQSRDEGKAVVTKSPLESTEKTKERIEGSTQATLSVVSETGAAQIQERLIERTQFYLAVIGLYDGPKDGVLNESLEQAIYRFQTKQRISADGRVSEKLLNRIKGTL